MPASESPKVSVVIPVYNQERYIRECLQSVLNQDYKPVEVIVIDDGSTDQTPKILEEFKGSITVIRQENRGPAAAINSGVNGATGSYVALLGSDDLLMPESLARQAEVLSKNSSIGGTYGDYFLIDAQGKELGVVHAPHPHPEEFAKALIVENFIGGSSVMVRKEYFAKAGCFDEGLKICEDWDMWLRLTAHGCFFAHLDAPLAKCRRHTSNITKNVKLMHRYQERVVLKALNFFSGKNRFLDVDDFDKIALRFAKRLSFQSAGEAAKSAFKQKPSLARWIRWRILRLSAFFQQALAGFIDFRR